MHHFFIDEKNICGDEIYLTGADYFHAVYVLRLKDGEKVLISGPDGVDYICRACNIASSKVLFDGSLPSRNLKEKGHENQTNRKNKERCLRLKIDEILKNNHELSSEITLFQCLPKAGNMELIIEKAVELGVSEIVPVASRNCVVKLDENKASEKQKKWENIAISASRQSKRSIIPKVNHLMNFKEAVTYCEKMDVRLIPYEEEYSLKGTCEAIVNILPQRKIGVFIGPEGGFDPLEISMAKRHSIMPISLGKRILRTETAAIAILSLIMIRLEIVSESETT